MCIRDSKYKITVYPARWNLLIRLGWKSVRWQLICWSKCSGIIELEAWRDKRGLGSRFGCSCFEKKEECCERFSSKVNFWSSNTKLCYNCLVSVYLLISPWARLHLGKVGLWWTEGINMAGKRGRREWKPVLLIIWSAGTYIQDCSKINIY